MKILKVNSRMTVLSDVSMSLFERSVGNDVTIEYLSKYNSE